MNLAEKVELAYARIEHLLGVYSAPAVAFSGGKDSMILLWLLRERGHKLPVVMHRLPFFPSKYRFANSLIERWDLVVYDWLPSAVTVQKGNGHVEVVSHYSIGGGKLCALPMNLYEGRGMLCGLDDLVRRPIQPPVEKLPWNVLLHGHKDSDVDPCLGPIPIGVDVARTVASVDYAFPIRGWTDADVWEFSRAEGVPQDNHRYDREKGEDLQDKTLNSDHFSACTRCLDPEAGDVDCPKLNSRIANNAHLVNFTKPITWGYLKEQEHAV